MKKALIALLAATIAASAATAVSAWVENGDYVKLGEITAENYPASPSTGLPEQHLFSLDKKTLPKHFSEKSNSIVTQNLKLSYWGDSNTSQDLVLFPSFNMDTVLG